MKVEDPPLRFPHPGYGVRTSVPALESARWRTFDECRMAADDLMRLLKATIGHGSMIWMGIWMKRRGLAIALVAGLTLGMALTACGQSDSGNESRKIAEIVTQGVSADKVITLGTWVPRSGPLAGVGSSPVDGGRMAFNEVNAAGCIQRLQDRAEGNRRRRRPDPTCGRRPHLWVENRYSDCLCRAIGPNPAPLAIRAGNKRFPVFSRTTTNCRIFLPEGHKPPAMFRLLAAKAAACAQ